MDCNYMMNRVRKKYLRDCLCEVRILNVAARSKLTKTFLWLSIIVAGCAPIPHFAPITPQINGTVLKNGVPFAKATVLLSTTYRDVACRNVARKTTSDASGYFRFEEVRKFNLYTTMGDRLNMYQLCIVDEDRLYPGITEGYVAVPDDVCFTCEINGNSKALEEGLLSKVPYPEVCRWAKRP